MLLLNDEIRKYDLKGVRDDEMQRLREEAIKLDLAWKQMSSTLEEKLKFCEKIHKKHAEEVIEYKTFADDIDQDKFKDKMIKLTLELQTDQKDIEKSATQLQEEYKILTMQLSRANKDLLE